MQVLIDMMQENGLKQLKTNKHEKDTYKCNCIRNRVCRNANCIALHHHEKYTLNNPDLRTNK